VMHDRGKSDDPVVPAKPPNNAQGGVAEAVEERGSPKGDAASETRPGRRAGQGVPSELGRVRRVARKDKDVRSPRSCITSMSIACGRRTSRFGRRPRRGWTA
jgi:hypothetical protein